LKPFPPCSLFLKTLESRGLRRQQVDMLHTSKQKAEICFQIPANALMGGLCSVEDEDIE
jgi:hypothetical protein